MMALPPHAETVRLTLVKNPDSDLTFVANRLLVRDDPELSAMWTAIERRSYTRDALWVWHFLRRVKENFEPPRYHNLSLKDRRELASEIQRLSTELIRKLTVNNLDVNIIHASGAVFNGFYFYEDFGESNRQRIDDAEEDKWPVSAALTRVASRAVEKIIEEPLPGKHGKNSNAIRFARITVNQNKFTYKMPLNGMVATLTNAMFDTYYSESDIINLQSR